MMHYRILFHQLKKEMYSYFDLFSNFCIESDSLKTDPLF